MKPSSIHKLIISHVSKYMSKEFKYSIVAVFLIVVSKEIEKKIKKKTLPSILNLLMSIIVN